MQGAQHNSYSGHGTPGSKVFIDRQADRQAGRQTGKSSRQIGMNVAQLIILAEKLPIGQATFINKHLVCLFAE